MLPTIDDISLQYAFIVFFLIVGLFTAGSTMCSFSEKVCELESVNCEGDIKKNLTIASASMYASSSIISLILVFSILYTAIRHRD